MTVVESFAIYTNGNYGIINEIYVVPPHRSSGVGHQLIRAAKKFGVERRWTRIDVTAAESDRWARTRAFYAREGFRLAGPKLKLLLFLENPCWSPIVGRRANLFLRGEKRPFEAQPAQGFPARCRPR